MNKVKILAVLPYPGLRELVLEVAKKRSDVEIHAFVADMAEGAELARSLPLDDYAVILSRAGTARLIEQVASIPVIDIGINVYDMLRAIRLSQSYNGKFAVVGFPMITQYAVLINDLMQYHLNIFTVNDSNEIMDCLNELKDTGYNLVVGDMITVNNARRAGLNTILVTSGEESVQAALNQSIKWYANTKTMQERNRLCDSILRKLQRGICVFGVDKGLQYCIEPADNSDFIKVRDELLKYVDSVSIHGKIKLVKKIGNFLFQISGEVLDEETRAVVFFYELETDAAKAKNELLTYRNLDDAPTVNLEAFTTGSPAMKKAIGQAEKFSATSLPVVICGLQGCGKDSFAYTIYRKSGFCCNPMISINCTFAAGRQWASLLESEKSPLSRTDCTIYFKSIHLLSEQQQTELESYLQNTEIQKRNRLIFSYIPGYAASFDNGSLLYYICNKLQSLALPVPTLNERAEDIPNLATLYLNEMNSRMVKQVIGLHPGALKALQENHWNNNLDQFKRVIEKLMVLTDSAYIGEKLTREVLEQENFSISDARSSLPVDLSGTLDEITKNVVKFVLTQENMNQSKAAKRLDISRSTLWKKLQ